MTFLGCMLIGFIIAGFGVGFIFIMAKVTDYLENYIPLPIVIVLVLGFMLGIFTYLSFMAGG